MLKKGQETLFWCCVEKIKKTKQKNPGDSLLFLSTVCGWIFPWAFSWTLITWAKCVTLTILAKNLRKTDNYFPFRQVKSTRKFFHALKVFLNFSFVCFHWKIAWHLGKVNKKVKTDRISNLNWRSVLVFGFHEFKRTSLFTS